MFRRLTAVAALMAVSFSAQAGLTTLTGGDWPPAGSSGLQDVLFNKQTSAGGAMVAIGAHAYKNGAFLANDGVRNFYAQSGTYAPDGKNYANWSFDFSYNLGANCTGCKVFLGVDSDPTAGVNFVDGELTAAFGPVALNSWNMEMDFLSAFNFDPFSASSTDFRLYVTDASGARLVSSDITVNVPEPGALALVAVALAGLGLSRRRKA